jgi:hypothetical protein
VGLHRDPIGKGAAICPTGKERLSKSEAKSTAKRSRMNLLAYRCPTCKGWHVGKPRVQR